MARETCCAGVLGGLADRLQSGSHRGTPASGGASRALRGAAVAEVEWWRREEGREKDTEGSILNINTRWLCGV